uniref:Uncharacterized protein n=1 Tax=Tanacetum cinerariifolium TaxID=118510 RepID=A0A6L2JFH9_TANCI|nr:hypothetical protein [Tanacetum cinerariifolium]
MVSSVKLHISKKVHMTKDEVGNEIKVHTVTAQQILARTRERKAKSTLLMAIPDEHLVRFHGIKDAKTLWAAIKTRFGEGLDKGYDRFQRLFSLLEIHEASVFTEDANKKFLRSLPSSWNNISLIMRNKPGIDNLDIADLYNNLNVYEADIIGSSRSSSNSHNVAFVYAEITSSTYELNVSYSLSTATGHSSQAQCSSSYAYELMFLFFDNQSSSPQLNNEDLEQINQDDLEEMDLKWQVAMLSMRVKRFYKKTRRKLEFNGKEPVGFDKTKVECFNYHSKGHFARDCKTARNLGNRSRDAGNARYRGRDNEEEVTEFALMAFTSNPSSSSSSNSELDEALREKEDLKAKLEKFDTSAKNLTKLLNSQISEKVKFGLGYDSQFNEKEVLDVKEEEVTETVFDNRLSDEENSIANDQFKKGKGYHTVPPPLTGIYMPPKRDLSFAGLDDFIYKFKISETVTSLTKDVKDAPDTSTAFVEKPKEVRISARLIQDWDTDNDNDSVFRPKHILAKIDFVKASEESKPVWNNVQRISHQNKFAPTALFIRSGRIPVTAAKPKVAASTSAAKPVNTAGPKQSVNFSKSIRNKAYLADYQEINNGSFDAFGSSREGKVAQSHLALVTKTHNKTTYELLNGRSPRLVFMRPFGCPVTILNTLDPLGKFEGKADEGFWLGNQTNKNAGPQDTYGNTCTQDNVDTRTEVSDQHHLMLPLWFSISSTYKSSDDKPEDDKPTMILEKEASAVADALRKEFEQGCMDQIGATKAGTNNNFDTLIHSVGTEADFNNMEFSTVVSHIPTYRVHIGLQVRQGEEGIFISQDKYVAKILIKFDISFVRIASTLIETQKPLVIDKEAADVDVYLYRSMLGSLMYLTTSRLDIMFAVCACSRFQVTPKLSHLQVVKRIFRYLKGQPKLGIWYPRDSPFDLECKKQTIVATSTTEAEYVTTANYCG